MTPAELAAIRERAEQATPGPWRKTQDRLTHPEGWEIESDEWLVAAECCGYTGSIDRETDAVFIAAAREDVPALLDHVDALRTRIETYDGLGVTELHDRLAAVRELANTWEGNGAIGPGLANALRAALDVGEGRC